jgi:signal transduction histidine kinase
MLTRIWNQHRRILMTFSVFVLVGGIFLMAINTAFAQTPPPPTWYEDPLGNIQYMIFSVVVTVFGGLMTLFGYAFDYTIANFVVGFGDLYLNSNLGDIIEDLWTTMRDLFNLGLIFGVVFIGLKLIFNSDDSGAQKMLGSLILAALLVNFSLFIVKFVIDFANILAAQIYSAFSGSGTIGSTFANTIKFSNLLNTEAGNYAAIKEAGWLYIFGAMILFLVTAFVFAAGAFMLTIRFIALNLYMVFSPLMFLGWVFPKMGGYSTKYWQGFMGKAFFAPAFIFMIYLSLQVINKYQEGRNIRMQDLFNNTNGSIETSGETFAFFLLAIGFMVASLMVANQMGATGASAAISVGHNLRKRGQRMVGSATAGGLAAVGRNTAGRLAYAATDSARFKRFAAKAPLGRQIYGATAKVADSSFDARKVGGVGKKLGVGEGRKGGFSSAIKEDEKARKAFLKDLGTVEVKEDSKEWNAAMVAGVAAAEAERQKRAKAAAAAETAATERKSNLVSLNAESLAEIEKAEREKRRLPDELHGELNEKIAQHQKIIDANNKAADEEIKQLTFAAQRARAALDAFGGDENGKVKDLNKFNQKAQESGEAEVTKLEYANQINYMDGVEKWQKNRLKWAQGAALAGGTAVGLATGAPGLALAGMLLAGNVVGGGYTGEYHRTSEVLQALRKEYGKDGTKKKKANKKKENLSALKDVINEDKDDKEEKKEEKED